MLAIAAAVLSLVLTPGVASAQPPCIPSPSIPPGAPNQCGEPTPGGPAGPPDYGPPSSSYSVDLPVAEPLAGFGVAGNAIATFAVPTRPEVGVVRVGLFISDREISGPGAQGYGNDRGFDGNFAADRTKLTLELNYRTGEGTAWATPSCAYGADPRGGRLTPDLCHAALPLDGTDSGSQVLTRTYAVDGADVVDIRYSAKQSFLEGVPGARLFPAAISGDLGFRVDPGGRLCVAGEIDSYPSVEIYRYQEGQPLVTLYRTEESWAGPAVALAPPFPNKNFDECG